MRGWLKLCSLRVGVARPRMVQDVRGWFAGRWTTWYTVSDSTRRQQWSIHGGRLYSRRQSKSVSNVYNKKYRKMSGLLKVLLGTKSCPRQSPAQDKALPKTKPCSGQSPARDKALPKTKPCPRQRRAQDKDVPKTKPCLRQSPAQDKDLPETKSCLRQSPA